jgi:rhamnulokinase
VTPAAAQPQTPHDLRALVAIDLGAESCRVSLLQWQDSQPTITLVHRFANNPRHVDGGLRWDLACIESGLEQGLRLAAAQAPEGIRSIAVDGWAVDYVFLDPQGHALTDPFCYRDERTLLSEESLHTKITAERLRELTGIQLSRINTLYQLHADPAHHRTFPWLNLPEYILHRLGARPVAELTNASHTQLLDLATNTWCQEILEAAGLDPTLAPELVPPGTVVGRLTSKAWGDLAQLPAFADTVLIAPATHDTASAIAGIPATGEDWAYISSGTWSLVGTTLTSPNNGVAARNDNYTNLAAAGGRTLFHRNVNGMWLLRQCLETWAAEGTTWPIPDLVAAAEQVPCPEGLLEVDDPDLLLAGFMPSRINAQRQRHGLPALDESAANAPQIATLIFHSLAARYAEVLAHIAHHTGKALTRLFIVGGGSQNLFLNRLTAQATGLQVLRGSPESSTLGNFDIQLATLESDHRSAPPTQPEISQWAAALESANLSLAPSA